MEKAFCAFVILVAFCSLAESRTVSDSRYKHKTDLVNRFGNAVYKPNIVVKGNKEGYIHGSCELLPTNEQSTLRGTIEFKQKAGSALEIDLSVSGLSQNVPYKLQVYNSGEIIDSCSNSGEPFVTERYNGHLGDIMSTDENGEVQIQERNVAATLFGVDCIFGRSIQVTSALRKEPEACCIIVHNPGENLEHQSENIDISKPMLDVDMIGPSKADWSNFMDAIYEEAEKNGIDRSLITKIEDVSGPQGNTEYNDEANNNGSYLENEDQPKVPDEIKEQLRESNISEDSIIKIVNLPEHNEMDDSDEEGISGQNTGEPDFNRQLMEEIRKNDISEESIIKIVEMSESNSNEESSEEGLHHQNTVGTELTDELIEELKKNNISEDAITKIVEMTESNSHDESSEGFPQNTGGVEMTEELIEELRKNNISADAITKIVDMTESNSIDESTGGVEMTEELIEELKKNNISEEAVIKIVNMDESNDVQETGDGSVQYHEDSNLPDELLQELKKNNISLDSIIKIADMFESENADLPNLTDQLVEELKKRNISEDSIIKIVDMVEPDNVEDSADAGVPVQNPDWSGLTDDIIQELLKNNISQEAILRIIDLSESNDKTSDQNTGIPGLTNELLEELKKNNISEESITKIIDVSEQNVADDGTETGTDDMPLMDDNGMNPDTPNIKQNSVEWKGLADLKMGMHKVDKETELSNLLDEVLKEAENEEISADSITQIIDLSAPADDREILNDVFNRKYKTMQPNGNGDRPQGSRQLTHQVFQGEDGTESKSVENTDDLDSV